MKSRTKRFWHNWIEPTLPESDVDTSYFDQIIDIQQSAQLIHPTHASSNRELDIAAPKSAEPPKITTLRGIELCSSRPLSSPESINRVAPRVTRETQPTASQPNEPMSHVIDLSMPQSGPNSTGFTPHALDWQS